MARPGRGLCLCAMMALACCAGPPLRLYTLSDDAGAAMPPGPAPTVIEIEHVTLPDELDNEDMLVRDGSTLRRSATGRWASRLSLQMTDALARRLASRHPDMLVTQGPEAGRPTYRVRLNIAQFDVQTDGSAHVSADWSIIPAQPASPIVTRRASFIVQGPIATDRDLVALDKGVLDRLAEAIEVEAKNF